MNEIMVAFWANTSPLRQSDLDWLRAQGISTASIAHDPEECGFLLSRALVVFDDDGGSFSFASELPDTAAASAFVLPARDESGEVVDVVAWRPKEHVIAAWRRHVPMAGLQNIFAPRLGEPLPVFSDPADWLKAERHGVLVIDMAGAAIALRDAGALAVHSRQQARHLRRAFASLTPHINIQPSRKEAA
ncbi:hypothetical protein [Methylocella sp. CPCC 101449]|uniref:hypothetical protein n=1 Tax=Methylocella sp. CPCC 101449 TaxID=2987531 RepID=UPI00288EFC40|nr:hypothetical protein [Methylocella sp. CPCC 101449]MDT2024558.1 hypothetical protein [Methylocella sp. CPCC 101449]